MQIKLSLLALLLPCLNAGELKLEQAIQLALDHNAELANARLDIEKAADRLAATHARLLPAIHLSALGAQQLRPMDFTIQRGELGDFSSTGPIPSNDVRFTTPMRPTGMFTAKVAQPLSGIYKVRLNLKLLDLSRKLAQEQARVKSHDVVQTVKKLYYEIQRVESSLNVTREMTNLFRETNRLTADYVLQQVALETDHLESQTNLARAEQEELTLTLQVASSKEQLNQILGRDATIEFTVSPIQEATAFPVELAVARRQALQQRPELRQSELKILEAQQEVRVKRAEYIPDVSAEFNATKLINFSSFLPSQSTSVGVSLTWEPFDWGRRKNELAEKRRTVIQARNTDTDARNKVLVDVDSKFRKLQQIQADFRVVRLVQKTAVERLRIATRRYQVQAALFKAVLESQSSLQQANSDYEQTLVRLWTARAEFEHAIGENQ